MAKLERTAPDEETFSSPTGKATTRSAFPQFALDAASGRLDAIGGALGGAADAIDELFERDALPFGQDFQSFAAGAAQRLRSTGATLAEQDAAELIGSAQRAAAARPALTIGLGAALGAGLAFALVRTAPAKSAPAKAAD